MTEHMHVVICFGPGDEATFYPQSGCTQELACRFRQIVEFLHENPRAVDCAAGNCDGTCAHSVQVAEA